jgi:hypothetical protein
VNLDSRPGPWSFHDAIYGLQNVVLDAAGRRICNHVSRDIGPLIAAAPDLALALWRISRVTVTGSPAHAIARAELDRLGYKRPKLRIVGIAR